MASRLLDSKRNNLKILLINCDFKVTEHQLRSKENKTVQNDRVYGKHATSQIKSCRTLNSNLPFTALHYCKDATADVLDSANKNVLFNLFTLQIELTEKGILLKQGRIIQLYVHG